LNEETSSNKLASIYVLSSIFSTVNPLDKEVAAKRALVISNTFSVFNSAGLSSSIGLSDG